MDILEGPHIAASGIHELKLSKLGLYSRGEINDAYKYLIGEKENRARLFSAVPCKSSRSNRHKLNTGNSP